LTVYFIVGFGIYITNICKNINYRMTRHRLRLPKTGDFWVDDHYLFEVGGKNKKSKQIRDEPKAYIVLDDIETGYFNQIPLWLFGFLY